MEGSAAASLAPPPSSLRRSSRAPPAQRSQSADDRAPSPGEKQYQKPVSSRLNTTGRAINMPVPLKDDASELGEVVVVINPDDSVVLPKAALVDKLTPVLDKASLERLHGVPDVNGQVTIGDLAAAGFNMRFDPAALELVFLPRRGRAPGRRHLAGAPARASIERQRGEAGADRRLSQRASRASTTSGATPPAIRIRTRASTSKASCGCGTSSSRTSSRSKATSIPTCARQARSAPTRTCRASSGAGRARLRPPRRRDPHPGRRLGRLRHRILNARPTFSASPSRSRRAS